MPDKSNTEPDEPRMGSEDTGDALLTSALRRYKAVVLSLECTPDVDQGIIAGLMESTKALRRAASATDKPRVLVFPTRTVLAAAACLALLLSAAVFFLPGRGQPDLVIINALPSDSKLFAMRGGETNLLSTDRIITVLKAGAVQKLGESRVAVRSLVMETVDLSALPDGYPAASLDNVSQRYVILVAEEADAAGVHYRFRLLDTRERSVVATRTLPVETTAGELAGVMTDLLEGMR